MTFDDKKNKDDIELNNSEFVSNNSDSRKKTNKRHRPKTKREQPNQGGSPFTDATLPLDVVHLDCSALDIWLVDSKHRRTIGRPYLTLIIDDCTKCILGFDICFEPFSSDPVGSCLSHAVLPKSDELKELDIKGEWPTHGLMRKILVPNAKEFQSNTFRKACEKYGISIEYRPVRRPDFGGPVGRVIRTINENIRSLHGTTFSNPVQSGEHNSANKAECTMDELRKWLIGWIVEVYHNGMHPALENSPLAEWKVKTQGLNAIESVKDPERFRIDCMPCGKRRVGRQGIIFDRIWYSDSVLSKFIGRKDKVLVRRDPRDISRIFVLDEESDIYHTIPYADTSLPAVSLFEYRVAGKILKDRGRGDADGAEILKADERLEEIERDAVEATRSMQKKRQQLRNLERKRDGQKRQKPSLLSGEKEKIIPTLVVDNTISDEGDNNDEGLIDNPELKDEGTEYFAYPHCVEGLRRLKETYEYDTSGPGWRHPGLLIYGPSNSGKTTVARRFQKERQDELPPEQRHQMPVVYVQCPPVPDERGLLSAILRSMGVISKPSFPALRLREQILGVAKDHLAVRMLIIDEAHHALNLSSARMDIFLDTLKYLSDEILMPIVMIGTEGARRLVATNLQHGSRYRLFHMERFNLTDEKQIKAYAMLIANICRKNGFSNPKFLKSDIKRICKITEGLVGETISFLDTVFALAKQRGAVEIDTELLKEAETIWKPPSDSRD